MEEKEKPAYYAIIPASVRYDTRLSPNSKLLYGEITALCGKEGYCWAKNVYFSELYEVTKTSISKWVSQLCECGHITSEITYKPNSKEVDSRLLRIALQTPIIIINGGIEEKFNTPPEEKLSTPTQEMLKDNTTTNNITSINCLSSLSDDKEDLIKKSGKSSSKRKAEVIIKPEGGRKISCKFSQVPRFKDIYHKWHLDREGFAPNYSLANLASEKRLINYLCSETKRRSLLEGKNLTDLEIENETIKGWELILSRWDLMDNFHRQKIKMTEIYGSITNILKQIKDASKKTSSGAAAAAVDAISKRFGK